MIEQGDSPYVRRTCDHSHLWLEDQDLQASPEALLPASLYIHVKDAPGSAHKQRCLLPGEGGTDRVPLFSKLKTHCHDGFVNVEVGGHIHKQPGDNPIGTARLCYERMTSAFEMAGLPRPSALGRSPALTCSMGRE